MSRNRMTIPVGLVILTALSACAVCAAGPARTPPGSPVLTERGETPEQHDARMAWWRDAKFGMFIHWGLYAQAGGEWQGKPVNAGYAEWLMFQAKVPIAEYAALARDFNPVNYDAEKWVLAARDAGMKYIVITAKHHEGFAMFKSAASPFNIVDATPFKRDPLKELAAACRRHGMKLGFYYSHNLDWHHPGAGSGEWDPSHRGDTDKYVDGIVIPQLREILRNYGDIAVLWFDMGAGPIGGEALERIHKAVLECNPNIIINNRLGGQYHGDTETPEQEIPANGFPGRDWETCMTINGTWGYRKSDNGWKSAPELLRNLCKIASKGGNYLLNVGPNELGEIPAGCLERLAQVGEWMKINGEAIYGTSATPFRHSLPWGWVTSRGSRLYLCVDKLPAGRSLTLPELTTRIGRAYLLTDRKKQPLPVAAADNGIQTITVPESAPAIFGEEPVVIIADLKGAPVATLLSFRLPGMPDAEIAGNSVCVRVPQATDLTALAPFYDTGSPLVTGKPASGAAVDFSKPQKYTIAAPDGVTRTYTVTVVPELGAVGVPNHSFEEFDFLNAYDETVGQQPAGATWTFAKTNQDSEVGITLLLRGPITARPVAKNATHEAPDGTRHCAFIRGAGSRISQAVNFDQGRYTVSFDVARRSGYDWKPTPLAVLVDGAPVLQLGADQIGDDWSRQTSPPFDVAAGAHTVAFVIAGGNSMDLIDNVEIKLCR